MAGIAQNGEKRFIFTVVSQVRTKIKGNSKREKKQQQQHENE